MKKTIITLIACTMALPLFAFNFNNNNFEIDANIKTQLDAEILKEVSVAVKENVKENTEQKLTEDVQNSDNEIVFIIDEQMKYAMKNIKRNAKLRKRMPIRDFVEEQKIQKQRYENMQKWKISSKIFTYIKTKFDLKKVHNVSAVCKYVGETAIDVHFLFDRNGVIVTYHYTETPWKPAITHKIFK